MSYANELWIEKDPFQDGSDDYDFSSPGHGRKYIREAVVKKQIKEAVAQSSLDLETARKELAAKDREIEGLKDLLGRLKGVVVDTILPNVKNVSLDIVEEMAWNSVCKETDEALSPASGAGSEGV